jgi:hypothetical protein
MDKILKSKDLQNNLEKYIYFHIIIYKSKLNKNRILTLINNTKWSGKNYYDDIPNSLWLFWIEDNIKCPQFQAVFCMNCGNYLKSDTNIKNTIIDTNIFCYCPKMINF